MCIIRACRPGVEIWECLRQLPLQLLQLCNKISMIAGNDLCQALCYHAWSSLDTGPKIALLIDEGGILTSFLRPQPYGAAVAMPEHSKFLKPDLQQKAIHDG